MKTDETNAFHPLATMFPDRRFSVIGGLFDAAGDYEPPRHQWILSGLAMLLHCFDRADETEPHQLGENSSLACPILRELQALEAAYRLGVRDGRREAGHIHKT